MTDKEAATLKPGDEVIILKDTYTPTIPAGTIGKVLSRSVIFIHVAVPGKGSMRSWPFNSNELGLFRKKQ
jgi:hypothetical protein